MGREMLSEAKHDITDGGRQNSLSKAYLECCVEERTWNVFSIDVCLFREKEKQA